MQTSNKDECAFADLNAVREFLLNGVAIPARQSPPRKVTQRVSLGVPVHQGIARARVRAVVKGGAMPAQR